MFNTVAYALQELSEESYAQIILRLKHYFQKGEGTLKFKAGTRLPYPLYYPLEEYFYAAKKKVKITQQLFDNFENFRVENDNHIRPCWRFQFFRKLSTREQSSAVHTLMQLNVNGHLRWFTPIEDTTDLDTKIQLADLILFSGQAQGPNSNLLFTRDGFLYQGRLSSQEKKKPTITICTQPGHSYCGSILHNLHHTFLMSHGDTDYVEPANSSCSDSFEDWMAKHHPYADYKSWTTVANLEVFTTYGGYYRLDPYVSEFIALIPIVSLYRPRNTPRPRQINTTYVGSLKECLTNYAKNRKDWEAKTSWDIREEQMPDQSWLNNSVDNVNSGKPSIRSVKNSKAWHNGKTVSKFAPIYLQEKYKHYHRFYALTSYQDLWEKVLYHHVEDSSRSNPPPDYHDFDSGGLVNMRYSRKRKKLSSRDIDRLIEESLF